MRSDQLCYTVTTTVKYNPLQHFNELSPVLSGDPNLGVAILLLDN